MTSPRIESAHQEKASLIGFTDWLGSEPLFFDPKSGQVASSIQSLTPPRINREDLDEEGLANFLDFGYSVFGKTSLKGVQFLPANSNLWRHADGSVFMETRPDPFFEDRPSMSEKDVIELIRSRVQEWEAKLPTGQEIVLPLSGGLDSRLLLWCVKDKARIRAFTYGTSPNQARSFEVVYARELAEKFAVRWEHIELGNFHHYLGEWNQEFGLSTHAHGMYQIEFYQKVLEKLERPHTILSGIVGDLWAGSIRPLPLHNADDLRLLSYSHGLHADSSKLGRQPPQSLQMQEFWQENAENLCDSRFQTVTVVRLKMMLLSYLLKVPKSMGFDVWSPFLDPQIALSMLDIEASRRSNRTWQREFFAKEGLLPVRPVGAVSRRNNLNAQALRAVSLPPLSTANLGELLPRSYVKWINRFTSNSWVTRVQNNLLATPNLGRALRKLRIDQSARAYAAYLCLYPLHVAMGGED